MFPSNDGNRDWKPLFGSEFSRPHTETPNPQQGDHTLLTALEKARKDPGSMKGKILEVARRIFGEYGFHGTTTRMIAQEIGIDISTLYYHWGEKGDLYEAVILDIYEDLRTKLIEIEQIVHGKSLSTRMDTAIEMMTDYLFLSPEICNLILFRYFTRTRQPSNLDFRVPEFISEIAFSMGIAKDRKHLPLDIRMRMLAMMNQIYNFVAGQNFFMDLLKTTREDYVQNVKDTLKFILIPAFAQYERAGKHHDGNGDAGTMGEGDGKKEETAP
jgi:AcrR family transcriptional regulator